MSNIKINVTTVLSTGKLLATANEIVVSSNLGVRLVGGSIDGNIKSRHNIAQRINYACDRLNEIKIKINSIMCLTDNGANKYLITDNIIKHSSFLIKSIKPLSDKGHTSAYDFWTSYFEKYKKKSD